MLIDYHVHAMSHGEYEYSLEWVEEYLNQARARGISHLGFSEHDWFLSQIDLALVRDVASRPENQDIDIRVGIEVDYKPENEALIDSFLRTKTFDYVIGSVHHIGEWPFDHPDHKDEFLRRDIDEVYQEYYDLLQKAVNSRLFDIVGHLDLVKVWGLRPQRLQDIDLLMSLLKDIEKSGMVVEVNTGGLRKPVNEIYPSENILELLFSCNIPITFGSDAHHPDQLGDRFAEAYRTAWNVGYRKIVGFCGRQKTWHELSRY